MREALTFALQDYEGGVVFVSHDRHLLRTCADELLLVADGKVTEFEGDLDDYAAWLAVQRTAEKAQEPEFAAEKTERLQQRADAKASRQALLAQRRPLIKEIELLEKKMAQWNEEKARLDEKLADPALYAAVDRRESDELHRQTARLVDDISAAEERWLDAQHELESLPPA
jgi:ATP-binding cassette subfamily F protein 3